MPKSKTVLESATNKVHPINDKINQQITYFVNELVAFVNDN